MLKEIEFYILDIIEEDKTTLWEVLSEIEKKTPKAYEQERIEIAYSSLNLLLSMEYIEVYRGIYFNGDEVRVKDFVLTKEFIVGHKDDWKITEYGDVEYKFAITEKGYQAYMQGIK